jgi:hypothetical protein
MGLGLLAPFFLAGLALLAIPVWIHLRHREQREPVRFPSLMFLRRIPFRESRRQQIHHWFLFLLRVGLIVLLAMAFARPVFRGAEGAGASPSGARDVVILLDRSGSMQHGDRWSRAQAEALAVVDGLGRGDRATVVPFAEEAVAATAAESDLNLLRAAIRELQPSAGVTRYGNAIRAARDQLAGSDRARREVVLVSDFQRRGWEGEELERLPPGTTLRVANVADSTGSTSGVVGVQLEQQPGPRPSVRITARVTSSGAISSEELAVTLVMDGRDAETRRLRPTGTTTTVSFGPVTPASADFTGAVRLAPDALPVDDVFHFAGRTARPLRVLLVEPADLTQGKPFLGRALGVGAPAIETVIRSAFRGSELAGSGLVVFNEVPIPGGDAARRLRDFVAAGGGVIIVLGDQGAWPSDFLPARAGQTADRAEVEGGRLGIEEASHPIFAVFRDVRGGDLAGVRVFRQRALQADSMAVLARFDDGSPALAEGRIGRGRVLVLATALDNVWNDLPIQPIFVPLMHTMARYAAQVVEGRPAWTIGQVATLGAASLDNAEAVIVVAPSGLRRRMELSGGPLAVSLEEAGVYQVREPGVGGTLLASLAANPDPVESDLTGLDPADLATAVGAPPGSAVPLVDGDPFMPAEHPGSRIWWLLAAAAALIMVSEIVVAARTARRAAIRISVEGA